MNPSTKTALALAIILAGMSSLTLFPKDDSVDHSQSPALRYSTLHYRSTETAPSIVSHIADQDTYSHAPRLLGRIESLDRAAGTSQLPMIVDSTERWGDFARGSADQ